MAELTNEGSVVSLSLEERKLILRLRTINHGSLEIIVLDGKIHRWVKTVEGEKP